MQTGLRPLTVGSPTSKTDTRLSLERLIDTEAEQSKTVHQERKKPYRDGTKRIAQLIIYAGFFIIAGAQTYSTIKAEINSNNIEGIAMAENEGKKFTQQGYAAFNSTRATILLGKTR